MRVVCIGSAMIDIIVMVESRNIERMTMHNAPSSFLLLEQGAKVEAESISIHCGGGAVNAAVAMRRLGADTAVLAKIGRDGNGERIVAFLTEEGVDTSQLIDTGVVATGQAVLVSSHDRNQTVFTQRGANGFIRADEIAEDVFAGCDLVYVSALSNRSADCFPLIMKRAMGSGRLRRGQPRHPPDHLAHRGAVVVDRRARAPGGQPRGGQRAGAGGGGAQRRAPGAG
jgi:ribokinase